MVNKTNVQTAPTTISIPNLRKDFKDRVIAPGDPDYDKARTVFYGGVDRRPAVIIKVVDVNDVVRVINLARESGLELAIRSGGHSVVGHSVSEGGIVLDLSNMKDLQIDPESRTAWAETGLTAGEFTTAAAAHGLAVGFGDTGSVGIGGLTLGGASGILFGNTASPSTACWRRKWSRRMGRSSMRMSRLTRTSSGRSAAAEATSAWRPASSSACTKCQASWEAC